MATKPVKLAMNVLQVNYSDVSGHRFNGGALIPWLHTRGHDALHIVGDKQVPGDTSIQLPLHSWKERIRRLEEKLSIHNVLYPQSFLLPFQPEFQAADIVHYHIVHNHFFSYLAFPLLTRLKPSVWSLHDPWALTGHCVHPFKCQGWKTSCKPCPHLNYPFAIRKDWAWLNFKLKDFVYKSSNFTLIVASHWMKQLVEQSPILGHFPVHNVPFGLDLNVFSPGDKAKAKAKFGIPPDRIVIGLRALLGPYKGLEYSLQALELLSTDKPVHVLTCDINLIHSVLTKKLPLTELGEIHDYQSMVDFFRATDIHLMPSMAESFGMMAMEAAACGVPSIVFQGTPLPEICFAPEGGIAVNRGDAYALSQALDSLIQNDEKRLRMGQAARILAEKYYDFDSYATSILKIYESVLSRPNKSEE